MAFRGHPTVAPRGYVGKPTGATNLCANGGFESNTTGWSAINSATVTRVRAVDEGLPVIFGEYVLKVALPTGTGAGVDFTFGAATTVTHTWGPWFYSPNASALNVFVSFTDLASDGLSINYNGTIPNSAWTRIGRSGTPANTSSRVLRINTAASTTGQVFYIDGVQVELGPVATPYIETNGATASRSPLLAVAP